VNHRKEKKACSLGYGTGGRRRILDARNTGQEGKEVSRKARKTTVRGSLEGEFASLECPLPEGESPGRKRASDGDSKSFVRARGSQETPSGERKVPILFPGSQGEKEQNPKKAPSGGKNKAACKKQNTGSQLKKKKKKRKVQYPTKSHSESEMAYLREKNRKSYWID